MNIGLEGGYPTKPVPEVGTPTAWSVILSKGLTLSGGFAVAYAICANA